MLGMVLMVLNGYGFFQDSIVVDRYRIVCEKHENVILYKRFDGDNLVFSKTLAGASRFEINPIYPVFYPNPITRYILVKFKNPIVLPSKSGLLIYIKIPVDQGVFVHDEHDSYWLIDVFSTNRVKYCLYGLIEEGVVARCDVSETYSDLVKPELGHAIARVDVRNNYDDWVEVGKLLLDTQLLNLYYREDGWEAYTQEISMTITSGKTARIDYRAPFIEDVMVIKEIPGFKPSRLKTYSEMLWGLM